MASRWQSFCGMSYVYLSSLTEFLLVLLPSPFSIATGPHEKQNKLRKKQKPSIASNPVPYQSEPRRWYQVVKFRIYHCNCLLIARVFATSKFPAGSSVNIKQKFELARAVFSTNRL